MLSEHLNKEKKREKRKKQTRKKERKKRVTQDDANMSRAVTEECSECKLRRKKKKENKRLCTNQGNLLSFISS